MKKKKQVSQKHLRCGYAPISQLGFDSRVEKQVERCKHSYVSPFIAVFESGNTAMLAGSFTVDAEGPTTPTSGNGNVNKDGFYEGNSPTGNNAKATNRWLWEHTEDKKKHLY